MAQVVLWFKNDLRLHDNYVVDHVRGLVQSGKAKEVRHYHTFVWPPQM